MKLLKFQVVLVEDDEAEVEAEGEVEVVPEEEGEEGELLKQ